ncbi:MAG: AAA family ATPase [Clostridium sp.]|nr:AAA family ATPase [Clostridium sp.]
MSEKFKDYLAMYCTEDDLSEEKYISQYLKGKEDGKRKLRKLKPYKNCVFLQLDDDSFNFPGCYFNYSSLDCVLNCDKEVLTKLLDKYTKLLDKYNGKKDLNYSNIMQYVYVSHGLSHLIRELKSYGFDGSFVMSVGISEKKIICANIGETSHLYYGYNKDGKLMFADNKESIIEKSVDKTYSIVMPNTYYDGEKFCILGEKYGSFVLTSDPNNTRSKAEMKKLKDNVKRFLTGEEELNETHCNNHYLLGANNRIFTSSDNKYTYMINCSNPEMLTKLWEEKFKDKRVATEDLILPYLYYKYGMKYTIDLLNSNGIDCSFVMVNNDDGLISAGKSGKGKLYYSYSENGDISFSSEESILTSFKETIEEIGDKYYDRGEFYDMKKGIKKANDNTKEFKKNKNKFKDFKEKKSLKGDNIDSEKTIEKKEQQESYNSLDKPSENKKVDENNSKVKEEKEEKKLQEDSTLPKEMMDFINDIISGNISDEVRDKIKKSLQEYLNSDEIKNRIKSSISGSIDTETKKELLKIVRNEVEKSGYKESVRKEISEEVEKIISEEKKKLNLPTVHIINLHGEEIGRTDAEHFHEKFEEILSLVNMDEPVMLIGPAGSGKNYSIAQVSKALNKHMYYTNNASNEFKLTGFIDAGGNYRDTEFYKAFKNGGVFFLDEIDNSDPSALIVINSALANGYMAFPHETIDRHPDFRMVAAANTWGRGSDFQYVGRNALDASTLDRFDNVFFDYDMALEEKLYPNDSVLDFMWAFRDAVEKSRIPHIVSTRGIGKVYKKEISGFSPETTLRVNVIRNLSQDDLNVILGNMEKLKNNKYYEACKKLIIK